jgi:hypothetical protein
MIAGHDRQRTSPAPEVGKSRDAATAVHLGLAHSGPHPEIAEIADDRQRIVAPEAGYKFAETVSPFRLIGSQMNVAGEIMGQIA